MIKLVALGVFSVVFLLLCYIKYGTGGVAEHDLPPAAIHNSPNKVLYVDNQTVVFVTGESSEKDSTKTRTIELNKQHKK